MSARERNLDLWSSVEKTDPSFTKQFSRTGGFRGTATNATYLAKRATETFGPMGIGWGINVIGEEMMQGAGDTKIHKVHARLWYILDGKRGEIESFGQTEFVGKNKYGPFTDEEAPKKSLTDAMTKALSLLGFAADIHLGLYDDNKYVNDIKREFAEQDNKPEPKAERKLRGPVLQPVSMDAQLTDGQNASPPSLDEQIAVEQALCAKVNTATTSKEIAALMTSDEAKAVKKAMPKVAWEEFRSEAAKRMKELQNSEKQAA